MSEEIKFASVYDDAIEQQKQWAARLLRETVAANDPRQNETIETLAELKQKAFKQYAAFLTGREKDNQWQAQIVKDRFSEPVFNSDHWRQIAWIDRKAEFQRAADDTTLHLRYKGGGAIHVEPQRVSFDEQSATKREAIEYAIIHAKTAWTRETIGVQGDETFKATAWAFAQVHGVKVRDYQPEGDALKLALKIITDRQAEEAKRPPNKPPHHGNPPLDLAA